MSTDAPLSECTTDRSRLPDATKSPCNECPWRRDSEPGALGPHSAGDWIFFAHSGGPIGCHKTIRVDDDWEQPNLRQCAGAAIFRTNDEIPPNQPGVAMHPADADAVFANCTEFLEHHDRTPRGTGPAR